MTIWILFCCLAILLFKFSSCDAADSPNRPLIIALPIRIQPTRVPSRLPPEDRERDDSEEEQLREQRIVPRTYNPNHEPRYHRRQQEENPSTISQSDFLTWNPSNKFMVLQISDFIGGRQQEESGESEENEKAEEPSPDKPEQNWSYQGSFDFEDPRMPKNEEEEEEERPFRNPFAPKKNKNDRNFSAEDTESDVYGTDPVLHFLRNKHNKNEKSFDFSEIPPATDDDDFGNWWKHF